MQSSLGNQGMLRLMSGGVLQRKLTINQPGDVYEQEADRVADTVMRMPDPGTAGPRISPTGPTAGLQRCSCGKPADQSAPCEECKSKVMGLQRSSTAPSGGQTAPQIVHDVLSSPGQPLDGATRGFMETGFGRDFSGVRVHTDQRAAESAQAVNALAYTVGTDIVFGAGRFSPESQAGRHLLAHELSHVVQQNQAPAAKQLQRACLKEEIEKVLPDDCPIVVGRVTGGRRFKFNVNCDTFAPGEEAALREFLKGVSSTSEIEVFGMASSDGDRVFNGELACARVNAALKVIKDEHLEHSVTLWGGQGPVPGTFGNPEFRAVTIIEKKGGPPTPSAEPELKNVDLTLLPPPNVITKEPDDPALKGIAIQVTLDDYVAGLGTADVVGGPDCNKFTLGFFQICRPFDTHRVIWHDTKLNTDFDDDRSDELRRQEPALDVHNIGDVWTESSVANCANPGVLRRTDVLFTDKPSAAFLLKPVADMFIKGMAWHAFFFNTFAVQRPDMSIHHLKSFYWNIDYCEAFDPPTGTNLLGKSNMKKSDVKIGAVIDGAPSEPGLNLVGKPAATTCNNILRTTKPSMQTGKFDITGSC
jgi:hypothetical protein